MKSIVHRSKYDGLAHLDRPLDHDFAIESAQYACEDIPSSYNDTKEDALSVRTYGETTCASP